MRKWKVAGVNFDHMHMGDLLRQALEHPQVELVGVSDEEPERVYPVLERLKVDRALFEPDYRKLMETKKPDVVILCSSTATHADWTERLAVYGPHLFVEKPFAATLADSDRMIEAVRKAGTQMVINWPLRWYPSHVTAKRLCDEGVIGEVLQVHYYDGNRGPTKHLMDKVEVSGAAAQEEAKKSWFYRKSAGGGALLDYLGYGTTLGTWYMNGRKPIEVTCTVDEPVGLEVDEHSITVARYETGLSKFETRWGTFTDPWVMQPQPKCGFVLVGRKGTISTYDYEKTIRVQTEQKPEGFELKVDDLKPPYDGPVNYFIHCLATGEAVSGPLSPATARIGQQIVDSAVKSAAAKRTVPLVG